MPFSNIKILKDVVVSEMSHKTDNNGFKKGTDFGFFYPFISAIRCCFIV